MLIRNRTGTDMMVGSGRVLRAHTWVDISLRLQDTLRLFRDRKIDVQWPAEGPWRESDGLHLLWMSPFSLADGYATAAEQIVLGLTGAGVHLDVISCWFATHRGLHPHTLDLLGRKLKVIPRVGICMATPGEFVKIPTDYRIGVTMYESTDPLRVHPEWRQDCAAVDELYVPCDYCKDVFEQFVHRPIHVVPLAINPAYHTGLDIIREPKETFTFFSHGTLTARKSPLELLEAFQRAFPAVQYPDVRMVFKTRIGYFGLGANQLPQIADPRIKIYNSTSTAIPGTEHDWTIERMIQEMSQVDAFIFPTRGEGYGLPPREAMAMGLMTAFTDSSGLKDVANSEYNWPIPVKETVPCELGGTWDEPDWDAVVEIMRDMYHNREAGYAKAARCAEWMYIEHGRPAVAQQWVNQIETINPKKHHRHMVPSPEYGGTADRRQLQRDHRDFIEYAKAVLPRRTRSGGGPTVWDIGSTNGAIHAWLNQLGFIVHTIVDPSEVRRTADALKSWGFHPPRVSGMVLPSISSGRISLPDPVGLVSMGALQEYSDREISIIVRGMLKYTDVVLISVPSIRYGDHYSEYARLLAMDQWKHIMREFFLERCFYYGPDGCYLGMHVRAPDDQVRGYGSKVIGYVNQGVWRPGGGRRE